MTTADGSAFYAEPVTGVSEWYALSWGNDTDEYETDKTLVILRTIEPSTKSALG